jgi:signal transduction histidine kinase
MSAPSSAAARHRGLLVWTWVLVALFVVAVLGALVGIRDVRRHVQLHRNDEISQRQSHADRSAAHIATTLLEEGQPHRLDAVKPARWLRSYWTRTLARHPYRLYAAVVDMDGVVVAHTDRRQEGRPMATSAARSSGLPLGVEPVELVDEVLTSGRRAIDVRAPIDQDGQTIGIYHAGIDADWLERQLAIEQSRRARFWLALVSGTCFLLLSSSVVVVRITRRTAELEHQIDMAHARRVSEMHELVLGIAHEIRNPLNAIRLNVHTVGQVFRHEAPLSDEEISSMLSEMEAEVVRLETLMREMLGFARQPTGPSAPLDVTEEIHRTLLLLRANLDERRIQAHLDATDAPCLVAIDATRLRQVLINLVNNAIDALPEGGLIELAVQAERDEVVILVSDDGPGIAAEDRDRVFVPFYSSKASGTGLGLALARKFIEEAGGTIRCEQSALRGGCCFRIVLPSVVMAPASAPAEALT